ncbi:lipoprotein [Spiroplasma culicicola]|uniref:Lipoprotein n=1 Tax=Spiroplasma culicicola AES-1 TaxID=1276246 RepID=W6A728_9MOLU|nr:lipoprotein [Spiroplasma culicicola]AHI52675.1 hypothetical protein SCULI_v1c03340 [Spiroplasma culicicola AES-1]
MKKLLTLFGALSLTSVSASTVVACGDPDDNGGGTTNPPSTEKYNLDDLFDNNIIPSLEVNWENTEGRKYMNAQTLFLQSVTKILEQNYEKNGSEKAKMFSDIGVGEDAWGNSLRNLTYFYKDNPQEDFTKIINDSLEMYNPDNSGTEPNIETQIVQNYEFKMDFNYVSLLEANKVSNSENATKLISKVNEGKISITIETLNITWYDFS